MAAFMIMLAISAVPDGVIHHGTDVITAETMIDALQEADIVFIGEMHDDPLAHEWELFIWESLASPERALALEMFETDVQPLLDSYIAGDVTGETFLDGSRPWDNYPEDYAPLVEFAKNSGCRVIAANVPRSLAAMVARGGLDAIAGESELSDIDIDSTSVLYRDMFLATMDAIGDQMHGMPVSPMNLYRAQLLKDAVMATSVLDEKCVFVCGSFHSDYHSGIPDQLPADISYLTVKILAEGDEPDPDMADFVIIRED